MLRRLSIITLLAALLAIGASASFAQKPVKLSSTPAAFQTFYKKFAATVNRGRIDQLATMTNFPFKYGFDAGDEGVWNKKQFVAKAGNFLMPQPLVFKHKDPDFTVEKGIYTLTHGDDGSYYTFKKVGSSYKWISYIVEP
jgi:hypothetical protein